MGYILFGDWHYAEALKKGDIINGVLNSRAYIVATKKVKYKYDAIGFPMRYTWTLSDIPFIRRIQLYLYPAYKGKRYCEGSDKPEFLRERDKL